MRAILLFAVLVQGFLVQEKSKQCDVKYSDLIAICSFCDKVLSNYSVSIALLRVHQTVDMGGG